MNTQQNASRRVQIGFSVMGSLIIIAFFAFINFTTGGHFPWFLFPSYAVLWWPIGVILSQKHAAKSLSLVGSTVTIAFLVALNYYTSWGYPWFLYPSFAILWWPLGVFFGKKHEKLLAVSGFVSMSIFFVVINYITSPHVAWFYYPIFALAWWPLSVLFAGPRTAKLYSVIGAAAILGFFTAVNLLNSNFCLWVLFMVFPVLMWPTCVLLGKRAEQLGWTSALTLVGIGSYVALNLTLFQGFPWVIFPAYALLWWPMSIALAKRPMLFSIGGTVLSAALFITLNLITSPGTIWAVYPIFGFLWWPLSVYYFVYRSHRNAV